MKRFRAVTLVLLVITVLLSPLWVTHLIWRGVPWRSERVQLVDYSVPYISGREHQGAVWLLNHEKYRPPAGDRWELVGSHAGYDPTDRDNPTRISSLDLSRTDWLLVTDSYGVYKSDLERIGEERAHNDFDEKIFGGMSDADAQAIVDLSARGRHILLEFNSLEEPTTPTARAMLEELFGVTWTGWAGRTFMNLRDTTDVPRWVPRLYKEQYGLDRLPLGPTLVMIHRDGRMRLVASPVPNRVAPRIQLTASGERALPDARGGISYFNWFPILRPSPGTEVLAEFTLPALPVMDSLREAESIPRRVPALTRRAGGRSHRVYLAADLADAGFPTGSYRFAGLARFRAATQSDILSQSNERTYWQFYVPAVRHLLRVPFDGSD